MNQDEECKTFQDDTPSCYAPPPSFQMDKRIFDNYRRTKRLATVEMILSCLILLSGMISIGLGYNHSIWSVTDCGMGTKIWASVIGIITAGLGLGALKYGNYSRKCLLVSHFVMCIISAIASSILILITSIRVCLSYLHSILRSYDDNEWCRRRRRCMGYSRCSGPYIKRGIPEALFALEVFILVGALAHMIASIVSTAFICRYWCGGKGKAGTTVLYIPNTTGNGNGPMHPITYLVGGQDVFIPSNATNGQGLARMPVP